MRFAAQRLQFILASSQTCFGRPRTLWSAADKYGGRNSLRYALSPVARRRNRKAGKLSSSEERALQKIRAGSSACSHYMYIHIARPCQAFLSHHVVAEHNRVEEIVNSTTLAWTIARPSALANRPPTGYLASLKLQPRTYLTARADLAAFIADELDKNQYVRQPVFIASRGDKQNGAIIRA